MYIPLYVNILTNFYKYLYKDKLIGRPLKCSIDHYFNHVVNILHSGLPWKSITTNLHYTTYYKFYTKLANMNYFSIVYKLMLRLYSNKCKSLRTYFIDSTLIRNINGYENIQKIYNDKKKGCKLTVIVDSNGIPISFHLSNPNIHDVALILKSISKIKIVKPLRIVGDKGYISKNIKIKF